MDTGIPPEDIFNDALSRIDRTIDESLTPAAAHTPESSAAGNTRVPNPYRNLELPSGKEPVNVGSGTIVGVLGAGGMAKVYKIWNEKLEVYRAVKILLPAGGKELTSRFETEAKITAKLHHPNIVEIYNVGEWHGLPFLEMEIIEGVSLDTLIVKYGKQPHSVVCAIAVQIARALAYAHSQEFLIYGKTYKGVIHRDLKPANIMIANRGDLKLMDFGIARPTEVGLHTMEGHIVGTLQYLSPEQLDGIAVDKRSDIYSFGAIMYEMLTGAKTFPQTTMTNLMRMKATNTYRKFNEFDFQLNQGLVKITEKCLQIDRNNRYESADALLDDLRKVFNTLTTDEPGGILRCYMQDPVAYTEAPGRKKAPGRLVFTGALAAIGILAAVLAVIVVTGRKPDGPDTKETAAVQPQPRIAAVVESLKTAAEMKKQEEPEKPPEIISAVIPVKKAAPITPAKSVAITPAVAIPRPTPSDKTGTGKTASAASIEAGEKLCHEGRFTDAVRTLEAISDDTPHAWLLRMWCYVETNNFSKARKASATYQGNDAYAELLRGRIEVSLGNDSKALSHYQSALTKPSVIQNPALIRNDALYYTALVHDEHFRKSPSPEARLQALTAWNNLKRVYTSTPNHPRFLLANKKLASGD